MQEKIYLFIKKIELFYYFIFSLIKIVRIFFSPSKHFLSLWIMRCIHQQKNVPWYVCMTCCAVQRENIF